MAIPSKSTCNSANTTSTVKYPPHPTLPVVVPEKIGIVTEEDPENGSGQFDRYMRAGTNQLQIQYDLGRIKGPDFAIAFVALQELMMVQGNKFILDKYTSEVMAHKTYLEINEIREKGKLERKLIELNILKGEMELRHLELQMDKTKNEAQLICTQEEELRKDGELKREETKKNGVKQREKLDEEIDLLQTQDSELKLNGTSKRKLETAQALAQGEQVGLYRAQAKGFADKNRNDTFKSTLNAWAINATEVDDAANPVAELRESAVSTMITNARAAAGI